jgi:hypothetical protein
MSGKHKSNAVPVTGSLVVTVPIGCATAALSVVWLALVASLITAFRIGDIRR